MTHSCAQSTFDSFDNRGQSTQTTGLSMRFVLSYWLDFLFSNGERFRLS